MIHRHLELQIDNCSFIAMITIKKPGIHNTIISLFLCLVISIEKVLEAHALNEIYRNKNFKCYKLSKNNCISARIEHSISSPTNSTS